MPTRCHWAEHVSPAYTRYHDEEWGRYITDDRALFELLMLELFQSGLSFSCVFAKREALRAAFADFDPAAVSTFLYTDAETCMQNPQIIRSRRKIEAVIRNARVFLAIQKECGSFGAYLAAFTGNEIPREPGRDHSPVSDALAADLKRRGMTYLGTKTVYAFLQASGRVLGHETQCFLYEKTPPDTLPRA